MITRISEEVVRKNGSPDKRLPQRWDVNVKGMAYLIVNDHLEYAELDKALFRLLNHSKKLSEVRHFMNDSEYRSVVVKGMAEACDELRYRINFQHFDQEYVLGLFFSLLEQAYWKRYETKRTHSLEDLKRLVRRSRAKGQIRTHTVARILYINYSFFSRSTRL